ncbi:DUF7159 family protein [Mycobacterium avium]|uniref:DUF7159 family protein n=1 Tax=Mycobacterium avium TaxID=1764 RepID=UPI001318927F|nr:hypothetical protein [Mycobacterium avium]QGW34436.1 hypothetical protein MAA44156_04287 [Mycobacterium avium subsp. avium]
MDIVLGVSMAPGTVRLVAIEGQNADGVTVEQEEFAVGAAESSANSAADQVIDAIIGTREGVFEGGHRLTSTGVTWTDPTGAAALRDAIASHELGNVMLVSPLLAAAALAQTVGYALGYGHIAMLFVEPRSATLAVVDVSDGSIVDLHRHQIPHGAGAPVAAELASMVAGLDARDTRADGVFVVGCGTDIVAVKPALEAASPVPVTGPEEPDMALARGAALASANAPLFASSTAALAYALDPGTGEMDPPAFNPTYLDVWGDTGAGTGVRAYSAVPDEEEPAPRRPWSMLLAGGALAGIAAVIGGVVLVTLTSDGHGSNTRHNQGVSVATPGIQLPAPPPSNPPAAQPPAPSTPAPAPTPPRWPPRRRSPSSRRRRRPRSPRRPRRRSTAPRPGPHRSTSRGPSSSRCRRRPPRPPRPPHLRRPRRRRPPRRCPTSHR